MLLPISQAIITEIGGRIRPDCSSRFAMPFYFVDLQKAFRAIGKMEERVESGRIGEKKARKDTPKMERMARTSRLAFRILG